MISKSNAEASNKMNEYRDCSVVALAEGLCISYEEAHEAMRKAGRRDRQGAYTYQIKKAIRSLGFTMEFVGLGQHLIHEIDPRRKNLTVNMVEKLGLFKDGHYIAFTNGHVLSIVEGKVKDWTAGRRHQITTLYRLEA